MKSIHLIFFDAGGGHRSAANALTQVIEQQNRPWRIETLNLQELFDSLDIFRKLTGMRMQDLYNITLRRGWTLGSPHLMRAMHGVIRLYHTRQVRLLAEYWRRNPTDLVVSLIPNFNRAVFQSLARVHPTVPMVTIMTDFADFPPHFWIEKQQQYLVCGTDRAAQQARGLGYTEDQIFRSSGMIVNPRFYDVPAIDVQQERRVLGLHPDLPTGLVLFGGHGSADMEEIVDRLQQSSLQLQLILLCGHNRRLAGILGGKSTRFPVHIESFTRDVPRFMRLADFFIGKPGPGSISEALIMGLPVIVERNSWTLPQERYNAAWVREQGVGLVLRDFRDIAGAVGKLLDPSASKEFRRRAAAAANRAVFEIPDFLDTVMEQHALRVHTPALTRPGV